MAAAQAAQAAQGGGGGGAPQQQVSDCFRNTQPSQAFYLMTRRLTCSLVPSVQPFSGKDSLLPLCFLILFALYLSTPLLHLHTNSGPGPLNSALETYCDRLRDLTRL